jgi:hypothetical protein
VVFSYAQGHVPSPTALCLLFLLCFSCLLFLLFTVFMCLNSESPIHGYPCFSFIFFDTLFFLLFSLLHLLSVNFYLLLYLFFFVTCFPSLFLSLFILFNFCLFLHSSISCPSSPSSLQEQRNQQTRVPRAYTRAISEHNLRIST